MNKLTTGVAALALMALSSSPGFAQAPDSGPAASKPGTFMAQHENRLDINGDGKIGWRERQAGKRAKRRSDGQRSGGRRSDAREGRGNRRTHLLERFDTDGDGKLDETERAVAREARRAKGTELRQTRVAELRQQVDRDGYGNIDRRERGAVRRRAAQRRQALPARARFFNTESAPRMQRHDARGRYGSDARRGSRDVRRQERTRSSGRRDGDHRRRGRDAARTPGGNRQRGQRGSHAPMHTRRSRGAV